MCFLILIFVFQNRQFICAVPMIAYNWAIWGESFFNFCKWSFYNHGISVNIDSLSRYYAFGYGLTWVLTLPNVFFWFSDIFFPLVARVVILLIRCRLHCLVVLSRWSLSTYVLLRSNRYIVMIRLTCQLHFLTRFSKWFVIKRDWKENKNTFTVTYDTNHS